MTSVCLSVCLFPVERVYNLVGGDHGYVRVECECDAKTAKESGIRWCLFKQQCHVQAQHTVDQEDFCGGEAAQGEVQQRDGGKQSQRSKAQTKPGKGSFAPDSKRQKSVDAHAMPLRSCHSHYWHVPTDPRGGRPCSRAKKRLMYCSVNMACY